jgi:hypothetical protein
MSIFSKIFLLKHKKKISSHLKKKRSNKNQQKNYLVAIKKKKITFPRKCVDTQKQRIG